MVYIKIIAIFLQTYYPYPFCLPVLKQYVLYCTIKILILLFFRKNMKLHALMDVVSSDSSFTRPVVFHIYERLLDIALIPALTDGDFPLD